MNARMSGVMRLWHVLRRYRRWMALGALLSLTGVLAGIGLLAVAGHFIAAMALAGAAGATLNYFTPAALIRLFAIVRTGGRYLERLVTHEATFRALSGLRLWLFDRLLPLAPERTGFLASADLFSRLRADVDRLEHAFLGIGVPVAVALVAVPLVLVVQAAWLWPLALLTAGLMLAVAVLLPWWLVHRGAAPAAATVDGEVALRGAVDDLVRGAPELVLYEAFEVRQARVEACTRAQCAHRGALDRLQGRGGALVPLVAQGLAATSLLLALHAYRAHRLGGADIAMLTLLALALFEVVSALPEALAQLGATRLSARRVFALADMQPAVAEPERPSAPPRHPDLEIRGLSARHHGMPAPVLDGIDLDLPAGTRVAITGASGCGKSTLVQVIARLLPFEAGHISLDGRPVECYAGDHVRALMSVVEQRTHIFDATLRDNLRVAAAQASDAALHQALDDAQLGAFVAALPDGLDTWLGPSGANLSGGEARRVAIARALLADRPILLLDEPTEGLDTVTAQAMLAALDTLTRGRTVVLISHRLGGLSGLVERVLRMDRGRLYPA
jgi:ATP-binding cassette subfamily C protein CydC